MHYLHCKNNKCRWHSNFESNHCTRELVILNDEGSCTFFQDRKLNAEEFYQKYCLNCGSQRCEGIGTDWFEGCVHKDKLEEIIL